MTSSKADFSLEFVVNEASNVKVTPSKSSATVRFSEFNTDSVDRLSPLGLSQSEVPLSTSPRSSISSQPSVSCVDYIRTPQDFVRSALNAFSAADIRAALDSVESASVPDFSGSNRVFNIVSYQKLLLDYGIGQFNQLPSPPYPEFVDLYDMLKLLQYKIKYIVNQDRCLFEIRCLCQNIVGEFSRLYKVKKFPVSKLFLESLSKAFACKKHLVSYPCSCGALLVSPKFIKVINQSSEYTQEGSFRDNYYRRLGIPVSPLTVQGDDRVLLSSTTPVQTEDNPDAVRAANITFASQDAPLQPAPVPTAPLITHPVIDTSAMPEGEWSIKDIMSKPIYYDTNTWPETDTKYIVIRNIQLVRDFFANLDGTPNVNLYKVFTMAKMDFHIRLMLRGTNFHQGLLIAYEIPLGSRYFGTTAATNYISNISPENATVLNHAFLDASESTDVDIVIPYKHVLNFLNVQNTYPDTWKPINFAELIIQVVVPLEASTGASSSISLAYFLGSQNALLHWPLETHDLSTQGLDDLFGDLSDVASAATSFIAGDYKGALSKTVKLGAKAVKVISNRDKPLNSQDPRTNSGSALAHGVGHDNSVRLDISPLSQSITPADFLGYGGDHMDMKQLLQRTSIIAYVTADSSSSLVRLRSLPITPMWGGTFSVDSVNSEIRFNHSNLSYLSSPFSYYRGSFKYTFRVVSTSYHKGTIRISHTYETDTNQTYTAARSLPATVFEIGVAKEFVHIVPWSSTTAYKRIAAKPYIENSISREPSTTHNEPSVLEKIGDLHIDLLNLVTVSNNIPSTITIVVMVSACDDFELLYPDQLSPPSNSITFPDLTTQGDEVIGDLQSQMTVSDSPSGAPVHNQTRPTTDINCYFTGSNYMNIKDLVRRYNFIYTSYGNSNLNRSVEIPITPVVDLNTSYHFATHNVMGFNSLLAYYSRAFLFWRGSLRLKIFVTAAVNDPRIMTVSYSPTSYSTDTRPYIVESTNPENFLHNLAGMHYDISMRKNVLEIEVPFAHYLNSCLVSNPDSRNDPGNVNAAPWTHSGKLYAAWNGVASTYIAQHRTFFGIAMAAGDDFQLGYYLGPSTITYTYSNLGFTPAGFAPTPLTQQVGGSSNRSASNLAPSVVNRPGLLNNVRTAVSTVTSAAASANDFFTDPEVLNVAPNLNTAVKDFQASSYRFNNAADHLNNILEPVATLINPPTMTPSGAIDDAAFRLPAHLASLSMKVFLFVRSSSWLDRTFIFFDSLLSFGLIAKLELRLINLTKSYFNLLSDPIQVSKDVALTQQGDDFCPSDVASAVGASLLTVASLATVGSFPSKGKVGKGLEDFGKRMRTLTNVTSGAKSAVWIFEQLLKVFKDMCEYFVNDSCPEVMARKLLDKNSDRFIKFISDVNELNCEEIRTSATVNPSARHKVFALRAEAQELIEVINKVPREGAQPLHAHYSRCLNIITKIADEVTRVNLIIPQRIAPYCLWLCGPPGTGKSLFSTMINQILCNDDGAGYSGCVYPRALDDQYWSNYVGQPGVAIDDLGAERGVSSYNQWTNFITLVSNVPKSLNMASIEEKGRMFTSNILTVTSNVDYPKPVEVTCPTAIWRRRNDMLYVYRDDAAIGGEYAPSAWRFKRMSPLSPGAYIDDKIYTFDEIVPILRESCKQYLAQQRRTLTSSSIDVEALTISTPSLDLTQEGAEALICGDIIEFNRGAYKHYGIVYSSDADPNKALIAHKVADLSGKPVVCTALLKHIAADAGKALPSSWHVNNFSISAAAQSLHPQPPEDIRRAINASLGATTYDPVSNNCEHFVTSMRFGKGFCLQVDLWHEPAVLFRTGSVARDKEAIEIVAPILNKTPTRLYDDILSSLYLMRAHVVTAFRSFDESARELGHYYIHLIRKLIPSFDPYAISHIDSAIARFKNPYGAFFMYCAKHNLSTKETYYSCNYAVKTYRKFLADNLSLDILEESLIEDTDFYDGLLLINSIFNIDLTSWSDHEKHELNSQLLLVEELLSRIDMSKITRISKLRTTGKAVFARIYKTLYLDKVKKWCEEHPTFMNLLKVLGLMIAGVGVFFGLKALFSPSDKAHLEGKYQVEKNRTSQRVIKSSIRSTTTALSTQGNVDNNADDIIDFKIKPNLVRISFYDPNDENRYLYGQVGIRLVGHLVLLNAHAFNKIQAGDIIEAKLNTGLVVRDVVSNDKLVKLKDKDLMVFCFNARMPCAPNIVDKFILEKDLPYIKASPGSLIWTNEGASFTQAIVTIDPIDEDKTVKGSAGLEVYRKGWSYHAHTHPGTCGAILLQHNPKAPRKLLGIHSASHDKNTYCLAECVTQECLRPMVSHFSPQISGLPIELVQQGDTPLEGDLTPIRTVASIPASRRTKIRQSLIHGVFEPVTAPAILYAADPRNVSGSDPLFKAINKYSKPLLLFENAFLDRAIESVCEDTLNNFPPLREIINLPTEHEALNGLDQEYYEPMDMKTSPGYPFVLSRPPNASGKAYLFFDSAPSGSPHQWSVCDESLRQAIDRRLTYWKDGKTVPDSFFTDCSKDERVTLAKIEAGKTRAFCMPPVDFTITGRPYFQDFCSAFYKHHLSSYSAVGINCESPEWARLYEQLTSRSQYGFAGDYSRYDGTIPGEIIWGAIVIIDQWYRRYHQSASDEDSLVRLAIAEEMIHTQSIAGKHLYQKHQGNPSGCFLTVILNTIVGEIYLRYIYLYISSRSDYPHLATLEAYKQNVTSKIYGDDNIVAVGPEIQAFFNGTAITEAFAKHGIEYTNASKTGDVVDFQPLHELTFLKRGFRPEGFVVYAPISYNTIHELCNWVTDSNDPQVALYDNLRDALAFAYHHGRSYFDTVKAAVNTALATQRLSPVTHLFSDFDFLYKRLYSLPPGSYTSLSIPEVF